ncbi:MAG: Dabb family protein [Oscillospiraceae bacterium]|nr:Dabb family protein [Oscillospiraceae bacterium]
MVKHIVVYTLKEGVDRDAAVKLIASKLEPLVGQIPGLLHMEVHRCYAGMDYALYSEFEKPEDVAAYRAHPLHQEAKSHFHHMLATRVSADYEI